MRIATRAALVILIACLLLDLRAAEPVRQTTPHIVAHRGLLRHAPENTLANFRACLELRLGFELDVERCRDGHLICIHDATVDRTTNGSGKVSELTLAELQRLDAGTWFAPAFAGERIPTIDEVFGLVASYPDGSALIAVDLKASDERLERDVVALAGKHKVLDRLLFIGRAIDHTDVRRRLRKANAAAHVARVANTAEEFPAALADESADWVYVRYIPTAEEIAQVHSAGNQVFIAGSTVAGRRPDNWRAVSRAGIDAILTDYPLELRRAAFVRSEE